MIVHYNWLTIWQKVKLDSFLIRKSKIGFLPYKKNNFRKKRIKPKKDEIKNVLEENMGECFYESRVGKTFLSKKQNLEDIKEPIGIFKT